MVLTRTEFILFEHLMRPAGRLVSRVDLAGAFIFPTIEYIRFSAREALGISPFAVSIAVFVRTILSGGRLGAVFFGSSR